MWINNLEENTKGQTFSGRELNDAADCILTLDGDFKGQLNETSDCQKQAEQSETGSWKYSQIASDKREPYKPSTLFSHSSAISSMARCLPTHSS